MSDPTKPQAATAKTARETIKAHLETLEAYHGVETHDHHSADGAPVNAYVRSLRALRALLDAPEGGVQALLKAGEETAKASDYAIGVLHDLDAKGGLGHDRHRQIQSVAEGLLAARGALCSALAALRASPESLGGVWKEVALDPTPAVGKPNRTVAPGLYRVVWKQGGTSLAAVGVKADGTRWIAPTNWVRPGTLSDDEWGAVERYEPVDVEKARQERDALKADLAAAHKRGDDNWSSAIKEQEGRLKAEKDLAAARGEVATLNAAGRAAVKELRSGYAQNHPIPQFAAAWDALEPWWTDSSGIALPPATPPTPAYAAADLTQIARMDRIEARVAAVEKAATLPPATEAPISERAATLLKTAARFVSAGAEGPSIKYLSEPKHADEWIGLAGTWLAAAERAAQGEGGAS